MARKLSRQGERQLQQANRLAAEAWQLEGAERRAFAEKALATSPLCAEAHILLASDADPQQALARWRRAASVAATAIGPAGFREIAAGGGDPDLIGPYVRALYGFAERLWQGGDRAEAIETLMRTLTADPDDEYALRGGLLGWLLTEGRDDDADLVFNLTPVTDWDGEVRWAAILMAFRRHGDSAENRDLARELVSRGRRTALRLTGRDDMLEEAMTGVPVDDPERMALVEAIIVAESQGEAWRNTPGALAWLETMLDAMA